MIADIAGSELDGLPFQIFSWIAASDGIVSPREVQVFLRMLAHSGWCKSRWARENLHRTHQAFGALWDQNETEVPRRDLDALQRGLRRLRQTVPLTEAPMVRDDLMRLAEAIARSSSGILGHATIRREERIALTVLSVLSDDLLLAPDDRIERAPAAVRPAARAPEAKPARARIQVRCVHVVDETPDVKTFRLALPPVARFPYLAGQFLTLELEIDHERFTRSYTIASSPSRAHVVEITVKRVPGGRISNWLHDSLKVGDELTITGPAGKFSYELVPPTEKMLFISGGSGVTPVMSMSRNLHDHGDPRDVVFLHSARSERDIVFRDELALLAARNPGFRTVFTLTERAPASWAGLRGRLNAELIEAAVPDFRDRAVFLCGPAPFMEAVRTALLASGFPLETFHSESFGGARPRVGVRDIAERTPTPLPIGTPESRPSSSRFLGVLPRPHVYRTGLPVVVNAGAAKAPLAAGAPTENAIVFSTSGQEAVGHGETILEAAEALGLSIPSACRAGVCGTCRTRKTSGDVAMDCDAGLDPSDRSAGFILACTAHPIGRVAVDV